jgi:hypothetical protein
MSSVLSEQAKQQVIALGRLGWSLRRIQDETGVRRETASIYLKAAGIAFRLLVGETAAGKTGHSGDHRLGTGKTGHSGDHRVGVSKTSHSSDHRLG